MRLNRRETGKPCEERGIMAEAFSYPFMYWVGMHTAPDTDEAALAEFNEFYTNIHVPEVMAYRGFCRGTRFELYREFRHPQPGCPRFCAIYEADKATTEANQQRRDNPQPGHSPLSSG